MSASAYKISQEGNGLMLVTMTVPVGQTYRLISVSCRFSAAPTTSEFFTVTQDTAAGAVYDVLLYTLDPSVGGIYSIIYQPTEEMFLEGGDAVVATYAGTDGRHWGVQITVKAVP